MWPGLSGPMWGTLFLFLAFTFCIVFSFSERYLKILSSLKESIEIHKLPKVTLLVALHCYCIYNHHNLTCFHKF